MESEFWELYGIYALEAILLRSCLEKIPEIEITPLMYNLEFFIGFKGRERLAIFVKPLSGLSAELCIEDDMGLPEVYYLVEKKLKRYNFSLTKD